MIGTTIRQGHDLPLFVGVGNEFSQDSSDLYFSGEPDDLLVARARLALQEEYPEANEAAIAADQAVVEVMEAYYEDDGVFHPHGDSKEDRELRAYLYEQMLGRARGVLGPRAVAIASDAWLAERLAFVQGFPPYHHDDEGDS